MRHVSAIEDFGTIESGLNFVESFQDYFQKKIIPKYSYFKWVSIFFADALLLVKSGNELVDDVYALIDKKGEELPLDFTKEVVGKFERILPQYIPVVDRLKNELSAPWFHINKHKRLIARYELLIEDLHDILAAREAIAEGDEDFVSWGTVKAELGL